MSPNIQVHHLANSSLEGKKQKFEKAVVHIGRNPGNDVVFDPNQDRLVSGRHAEIIARGEKAYIRDLGSSNGTFVNNRQIRSETRISAGDRISMGYKGPELEVSLKSKSNRGTILGFGGTQAGGQGGIGLQTMMHAIERSVGKERKRTIWVASAAGCLLLIVLLGSWRAAEARDRALADDQARLAEENKDRLAEIAADISKSVYLVTRQRQSSGKWVDVFGGGTAWQAAPGTLATNSHVAVEFVEAAKKGQRLIARQMRGDQVVEIVISSVKLHPGYESFRKITSSMAPYIPGTGFLRVPPAWDVALMYVNPTDAEKMGAPLEIASRESMIETTVGNSIAYVGFPTEGVLGSGINRNRPMPTVVPGRLSKIQDFFLSPPEGNEGHLMTMTMGTSGGASGSPVVNSNGQVVAVLNSGDVLGQTAQGRIGGNNTYAMRADLVLELLDGSADSLQPTRETQWKTALTSRWQEGVVPFGEEGALVIANQMIKDRRFKLIPMSSTTVSTSGFGESQGKFVPSPSSRAGTYLCLASSAQRPMRVGLMGSYFRRGQKSVIHDRASRWYAGVMVSTDGSKRIGFVTYASEEEAGQSLAPIEVRVYRVEFL